MIKEKYGLLFGPKGNRVYGFVNGRELAPKDSPKRVAPIQPGTFSRRNLEHMPK